MNDHHMVEENEITSLVEGIGSYGRLCSRVLASSASKPIKLY